jgi:ankyrin repeat protein
VEPNTFWDTLTSGRQGYGERDVVQSTALCEAAFAGQLDAARLLLDTGADLTPLMMAAGKGHAAVVRELAARGAALDAAGLDIGATAFYLACGYNQPECVAVLVELGCDTAIKCTNGLTGKQAAEQHGHAAVLDVLRDAVAARLRAGVAVDQPGQALYQAGRAGDLAEMARLLDGGAEPDAFVAALTANGDTYQSTALGASAADGQLDAVRLLLDRGADPSLAESLGFTPLTHAAVSGHPGVVRELVACGADLDAAHREYGATAFYLACGYNQPECVAVLVELGCDTAITSVNGLTGKQVAEQHGHAAVLDVLRDAVAGQALYQAGLRDTVDQPGQALYQAGQAGDLAEMARLLDGGAEPDALVFLRDTSGAVVRGSALLEAAARGQLDGVRRARGESVSKILSISTEPVRRYIRP